MATAGLATFAIAGAALGTGSGVANAASATPLDASTTTPASAADVVAAAVTPLTTLTASSASAGKYLDLTTTAKTPNGTPLAGREALLQRKDGGDWVTIGSTKLSDQGRGKFHFKIWHSHSFRIDLPAVTDAQPITSESTSKAITVKPADPNAFGKAIAAEAAKHKGAPYIWAAAGPRAFDCSGLVKYVFAKFGINLPHHADDMKRYGKRISRKDARPGDLVFVFTGSYAHHVAIYAGNGTWWEAPHAGSSVRHVKIWSNNIEFRRITPGTV